MDIFEKIDFTPFKRIKFDVGLSYNAPYSKIWLDQNRYENDLIVVGFEPNPECHPNYNRYMPAEYIGRNFKLMPVALGNVQQPTTTTLHVMANDCGTSSLFAPRDPRLGDEKCQVEVPVYSLAHFMSRMDWNRFQYIEFLKVDAQGSDLDILKGAGDWIEKVVYVTAEPDGHQYHGCDNCNTEEITKYMESHDFVRVQHPNTTDPTFLNNKFKHLKDLIYIKQA